MKSRLKSFFHKSCALLYNAGALRIVFFAVLLFSGISLSAQPVEKPLEAPSYPSHNTYSGSLTANRDCEAPVLRYRFGQQLQLNLRNTRPGQAWNLQRNSHLEGKLLPEFCRQLTPLTSTFAAEKKVDPTYQVYSKYTLPVRAGPSVSTTEQSYPA